MMQKLRVCLIKLLYGGHIPIAPSAAIWKLIDEENQKPEDDIRCDFIQALVEAADRVDDFQ